MVLTVMISVPPPITASAEPAPEPSGDGHAYLDFASTGIQVTDSNGFKDGTYLNGEFYEYLTSDNTQQRLTLDPAKMQPGEVNVFSFAIGNGTGVYDVNVTPAAINHDDFTVGAFVMTLPNGETVRPAQVVLHTVVNASTPAAQDHNETAQAYSPALQYRLGDGFPAGSDLSMAYRIDIMFDLAGAEWDGSYTPIIPVITLKNISLEIGADPTRRNVVWYSNSASEGNVQLAPKSAVTGSEFPAVHTEFNATKEVSNVTGFSTNKATITGLAANTEYVYRVGNSEGWSDAYSFKTQSFDGDFSFLAAGDPQIGVRGVAADVAGWTDTLNKAFAQFPDTSFLVTLGDQVQNAGSEAEYDGLLSPDILKSMTLATVVGNHDTNPIYSQHFNMPNASTLYGLSRTQDNLGNSGPYSGDYWYVYNNTLFMSLNITNLSVAEHRAFMEEVIAANPDVKWKVVTEHFSLFHITNSGYWNITDPLRNELAPEFSRLGIDVVLNGHDHSYQRTYLMNGTAPITTTGGSEVTNPAAGGVLYINTNSASGSLYVAMGNTQYPFIAVKNQENVPNISKVDVTDTSFTITTYRTNNMSVVDSFTINKTDETEPRPYSATLIERNSIWKYNDTNTDQGTAWRSESFDAGAWKTGKGPLGYPAGDANGTFGPISSGTLVDNRSNPNAYITYYFRNTFDIPAEDLAKIDKLDLTVGIDDGYVMYINGTEVRRLYMPEGDIDWQTWATYVNEPSSAEGTDTANITAAALPLLKSGTNTVAVEVHNRDNTSSDIYFDMRLTASGDGSVPAATVKNAVLNIGANEGERNIVWYSDSEAAGEARLALKSDMIGDEFPAVYQSFAAARTASSVSDFGSYSAAITGLSANTEYVYRVGNDEGLSEIYGFKTGDFGGAFSFLAAGDPQIGSSGNAGNDTVGWTATLNHAKNWFGPDVDFLISLGDQVETSNNENEYNGFLTPDYLRSVTLATNIGNHDSSSMSNGVNYKEHFNMPNSSASLGLTGAGGDYWYAYNGVLFMSINTNNRSTAEHSAFLSGAIDGYKAANGGAEPTWKIVSFHHSIYSSASHTTDSDIRERRNELSPVFAQFGIDAVLAGHDHVYTRSLMMDGMTPITDGYTADGSNPYAAYTKANPNETLYITANSASGSKYYALKQTDFGFVAEQNQENTPNITKVDVTADALVFTTYRTGAGNAIGDIVDTFTLSKQGAAPAGKVLAAIRANETSLVTAPVEYTVSLSGLNRVNTVKLTFTADGNFLGFKELETLNGFTTLTGGDVTWTELGAGLWQGEATLIYGYGEQATITSAVPMDVAKIVHNAKALGDARMTLTGISVTGLVTGDNGNDRMEMIAGGIDPEKAGATTSIGDEVSYSIYDLNKDGAVDQIDLAILALYCGIAGDDSRWDTLVIVYDTKDVAITASLCDVNADGVVNMLDLLDLFMNYTR
jgi:hypothetical protein